MSAPDGITTLLLGTGREWFASALEAVLHSEGFSVVRAGSVEELLDRARRDDPELVMVDESLSEMELPEVCRRLREGPLPAHVPLIVYTETYSGDGIHAAALDAGAWEILNEPIRARVLVSALRRLLDLSRRVRARAAEPSPLWDEETGLFTETGLERVLPALQALASRQDVGMTCVVVGPTRVGRGEVLERQRLATADLCALNVRASDVCGWLGEGELAIIAFDTPAEGATTLAERLNQVASGRAEIRQESRTLSAGIVELLGGADGSAEESEGERGSQVRSSARTRRLEAARGALRRAREGGGGIRVAEVA
ncbi:MAG: response regulator [Acidobacteriota bacterium]